ncbi:cytochrome P450 [Actinomadura rupiterrae]|uniref:cytochrome P450 n=1 Tax=Actinomadura rupiterrae TaxID=559627 RepID=UPI0020A30A29|nr:cytochrome P450 [Actinomadura rupiterrae]MCP2334864.1 cytochrome P450 [Actinomadura rupiterrae]
MTRQVPRASVADTLRVLAAVVAPTVAKGVLARRPRVVAAEEQVDADGHAVRLLTELRGRYGHEPLLLNLPGRDFALVLHPDHVHRVLDGSPEPFAVASLEKRAALRLFQPHGVLVTRGSEREELRERNEVALDTGRVHRHAGAFLAKIDDEAADLLRRADRTGVLAWDDFRRTWWRVVRRIVLGDAARDDSITTDLLTRLRMDANWAFAHPNRPRVERAFASRLHRYAVRAAPDALASPGVESQMPQWLFAYEPAAMAAFRALALLAAHPEQASRAREEAVLARDSGADETDLPFLRACVQESLRLWPTSPAILRDTTEETVWNGHVLPQGSGLLLFTPFLGRDAENLPYADAFTPDLWLDGRPEHDWEAIPFSAGPAQCPGRDLVLLTTSRFLAALLERHDYHQRAGKELDPPRPLPHTFSPFRLAFDAVPAPQPVSTAW